MCNVSAWLCPHWGIFLIGFFRLASVGGTAAVAAGGGGERRCHGCAVAAQGFTDMGHEEGVVSQLQNIHTVLLVISQATSNEGLWKGRGDSLFPKQTLLLSFC